jgi:hypothetical protein
VWPLAARAQQRERVRRVGVLMPGVVEDPQGWERYAVFRQALEERGWREGHDIASTFVGPPAIAQKLANMPPNWSRSHRTSANFEP